jgi:Histone methylation protein DOT1
MTAKRVPDPNHPPPSSSTSSEYNSVICLGLGGFVILNLGLLLSILPVLIGRGAPYLPTRKAKVNDMFAAIRLYYSNIDSNSIPKTCQDAKLSSLPSQHRTFVDLGSGDGRLVFRAAREGIFHKSIGYEINPCKFHVLSSAQE